MMDNPKNLSGTMTLIQLCEGLSKDQATKIKVAYWIGCNDGMNMVKEDKPKVARIEGNVIYLKDRK